MTGKGPRGFTVKERKGGTSGIPFSYRAVATRKAPAREATAADAAPRIAMPTDVPVPTAPERPTPGDSKPERPREPDAR